VDGCAPPKHTVETPKYGVETGTL
jgi:hypothetical protein